MRQKLGQHFLINKKILQTIADALDVQSDDTIVEIGPGHGELTDTMRSKNKEVRMIAIEKDIALVNALRQKYMEQKNTEIIEGDVREKLKTISLELGAPYKLTGNIPYYLTNYLFRLISELEHKPSRIVFTIQKEVAERIAAEPPHTNLLAASIQIWAKPEIVAIVPGKDFSPPPEVESAVILLVPKKENVDPSYYRLIRAIFKQPRKTILNNLTHETRTPKEEVSRILAELGLSPGSRPGEMMIEDLAAIAGKIFKKKNSDPASVRSSDEENKANPQ